MIALKFPSIKTIFTHLTVASCLMLAPYCYSATRYQCPAASQVDYRSNSADMMHWYTVFTGKIQTSNGNNSIEVEGLSASYAPEALRTDSISTSAEPSQMSCSYLTGTSGVTLTTNTSLNFAKCTLDGKKIENQINCTGPADTCAVVCP